MGMTIDNTCEPKPMSKEEIVENLKTMVFGVQAFERFNAKERETLDRAWNIIDQYENRLKADMVAMLTDFLMDIEENTSINSDDGHERNGKRLMRTEIIKMLEDKINSLKEAEDGLHTRQI